MTTNELKSVASSIKSKIILFEDKGEDKFSTSHLKTFLNFLNYAQIKKPIRFSHIPEESQIITSLGAKETLRLSLPPHLTGRQEFQLDEYFSNTHNSYCSQLYLKIAKVLQHENKQSANCKMEQEEIKIVSLLSGIIRQNDFLLLESPEKYLAKDTFNIFFKALLFNRDLTGSTIIVSSNHHSFWMDHAHYILFQDHNMEFRLIANAINIIHNDIPQNQLSTDKFAA